MPRYTVVGKVSADQTALIVHGVYRGEREDKVPHGGWGHALSARNPAAARRQALRTFQEYTTGALVFEVEFAIEPAAARTAGWRWPWSRKRAEPDREASGPMMIV